MSESHAPRVVATHVEADGRILITVEVTPELMKDILGRNVSIPSLWHIPSPSSSGTSYDQANHLTDKDIYHA